MGRFKRFLNPVLFTVISSKVVYTHIQDISRIQVDILQFRTHALKQY